MESSVGPTISFKSKKPLLTTPNKNPTTTSSSVGPNDGVPTPERANPAPNTRIRNKSFALSISDVRRTALQLRKPTPSGSDPPNAVPEKWARSGDSQKPKGSDKSSTVLPEKYEMLCEFFNSMMSAIRLLRMRKSQPTLTNLATSINDMTNRRFTLHHLAQLKYIVPEVIVVKKVCVLNEKTNCMEEDLHVSLELDALKIEENVKFDVSKRREVFRALVVEYMRDHPDEDVPEGELPRLFHQPRQQPEPNMSKTAVPLVASLTAPSFKRRFSSRAIGAQVTESMVTKPSSCLSETTVKEAASAEVIDGCFSTTDEADAASSDIALTPAKSATIPTKLAWTPAELASTPARLMAATPTLRTPKRSLMSPEPNKSAKRSRSLNFDESSVDFEESSSQVAEEASLVSKDDVLGLLPDDLLQSLREKERKMLKEKDPIEVRAKRRQQMMAGLPKLFDMIRLMFQSINRSVITKEELIYKILTGHVDIVDRSEVEEQLKLLQEVAPEYISEHQSLSGDTLLRLNKSSCSSSIRAMLLKAQ